MPSKRQTYPLPTQPRFGDEKTAFDQRIESPANAFEALMVAEPHAEILESVDEKQERFAPLRDALEDGEVLDPREVWVIEALFWRQIGLRTVAAELSMSKTQVARIRDAALAKLANELETTT